MNRPFSREKNHFHMEWPIFMFYSKVFFFFNSRGNCFSNTEQLQRDTNANKTSSFRWCRKSSCWILCKVSRKWRYLWFYIRTTQLNWRWRSRRGSFQSDHMRICSMYSYSNRHSVTCWYIHKRNQSRLEYGLRLESIRRDQRETRPYGRSFVDVVGYSYYFGSNF